MALTPTTIKTIIDKIAEEYRILETAVDSIDTDLPFYFPAVTATGEYDFERRMITPAQTGDTWTIDPIIRASPLAPLINGLANYFQTNGDMSDVGTGGALDNYLYVNSLTAYKYFADAQYYVNYYKMAGILVDNTDVFTFAECGQTSGAGYFTSLGSYQTDDINLPYGVYTDYTSYAPTDQVEVLIVSGTINFDIRLICKDINGDTFVFEQNISGSEGETVKLDLTEKITGCSGLAASYSGTDGDILRIQTIAPEV